MPAPAADNAMIAKAVLFAARAHDGIRREDKGDGYFIHLAEVAHMCAALEPFDPVLVAACYLHDAVEDTNVTEETVRSEFGDEIADLVMEVTDPPDLKGKARRERQVAHTAAAGPRVKRLKLADKLHADVVAYGNPTWADTSGSAGGGAYRADTAGLYARLDGRLERGAHTLTPSVYARYKWTHIGGYVDDGGESVPAQTARSGKISAALNLARNYDMPSALRVPGRISPYMEVGIDRKLDKVNRVAIASESSLEKGYATARAKLGAETAVTGGATVNVSGYMLQRLDNQYREVGTRARLGFKF